MENLGSGGLVSDAIGAILRHIRDNDLMPGDRLPSEASLSKELNVSRTVVRESFRSLAAMSLMIEHGVHTDQINVQQIYDVRSTIETQIVTLAAIRRSDTEGTDLLAQAMGYAVNEPARLMELDLSFHLLLAQASRNLVFCLIIGAFQGITRQTWPIGWKRRPTPASRELMLSTHVDIACGVAASNPQHALASMSQHFDESERALLTAGLT